MTITLDQIPGIVVDAAMQQALSDIGNNQKHIPVKFHENCGQTQAGIWEPSLDFNRIIYQLKYLGLPWTNDESGLDTDVDKLRLRTGHGRICGQFTGVDYARARTDYGHGQIVERCADTSGHWLNRCPDIYWALSWMIFGRC